MILPNVKLFHVIEAIVGFSLGLAIGVTLFFLMLVILHYTKDQF